MEEHLSRDLLALYQREAQAIGFSVEGEFTGGCADSGFTASLGVPTLCGLGPVGGKCIPMPNSWCSTPWFRAPSAGRHHPRPRRKGLMTSRFSSWQC